MGSWEDRIRHGGTGAASGQEPPDPWELLKGYRVTWTSRRKCKIMTSYKEEKGIKRNSGKMGDRLL